MPAALPLSTSCRFLGVRVTQGLPDRGWPPRASSDPAAQGRCASGFGERGRTMDEGSGLREGYAEVGDQRLHYAEAGEGPLVMLLHGFP